MASSHVIKRSGEIFWFGQLSSCICKKNFAEKAQALYSLTGKNKFRWGQEEQEAFESLKVALVNPPVLGLPNTEDPFILDTDASDTAIGAELLQISNGEEKVVLTAAIH